MQNFKTLAQPLLVEFGRGLFFLLLLLPRGNKVNSQVWPGMGLLYLGNTATCFLTAATVVKTGACQAKSFCLSSWSCWSSSPRRFKTNLQVRGDTGNRSTEMQEGQTLGNSLMVLNITSN